MSEDKQFADRILKRARFQANLMPGRRVFFLSTKSDINGEGLKCLSGRMTAIRLAKRAETGQKAGELDRSPAFHVSYGSKSLNWRMSLIASCSTISRATGAGPFPRPSRALYRSDNTSSLSAID